MVQLLSVTSKDQNFRASSLKNNMAKPQNFGEIIGKMQKEQQNIEYDLKSSVFLEQLSDLQQKFSNIEELFPQSQKIDPLKILLTNIQGILQSVENDMVLDEEMLINWSQNMIDFIRQSLDEYAQTGDLKDDIFFPANYLAFVVDNVDISFFQEDSPKQNILFDMIQKANDVHTQNIKFFTPLEELLVSEPVVNGSNELGSRTEALDYEVSVPDDAPVFFVKDNRMEPQTINEIKNPLILEVLDENQITVLAENTAEIPSQLQLTSGVQRAYESFSSSVSRIQVEAMMQNIAGKAFITLQDGSSEMKMKLTPPELGHMKLSFRVEDGIMSGKIVVGTQEARFFFEQNLDNLRQSLAEVGIMLAGVDVQLDGGSFQEPEELHDSTQYKAIRFGSAEQNHEVSNGLTLDTIVDYTV